MSYAYNTPIMRLRYVFTSRESGYFTHFKPCDKSKETYKMFKFEECDSVIESFFDPYLWYVGAPSPLLPMDGKWPECSVDWASRLQLAWEHHLRSVLMFNELGTRGKLCLYILAFGKTSSISHYTLYRFIVDLPIALSLLGYSLLISTTFMLFWFSKLPEITYLWLL